MDDFDARLVLTKFIRKWHLFAISIALLLFIAFLYLQASEKKYLVQAAVQLKDESLNEKGSKEKKFINGLELLESSATLEDEIGILTSYSTVKQTVEKMRMYTNVYKSKGIFKLTDKVFSEEIYLEDISIELHTRKPQLIDVPVHISFLDKETFVVEIETAQASIYNFQLHRIVENKEQVSLYQLGFVGKPFTSPFLSFTLLPLSSNDASYWQNHYYFINRSLKDLSEAYQKKLTVTPIAEKANIVNLELKGPVAQKEVLFLNTLSDIYVKNDLQKRSQLGINTISFIDSQLNEVADTLSDMDSTLAEFRAKSNVVDIGSSAQTLTDLLNQLEEKQIERKAQMAYYHHLAGYLTRKISSEAVIAPSTTKVDDPTLIRLIDDLSALQKERASASYTSNSPKLIKLDQKIENTRQMIAEDVRTLIVAARISISENQRRIDEVKENIAQLPENERSLNNIQRKFQLNDDVYKYLLQKRAEASIAIASNAPGKSIIDPAHQVGNKAVFPNALLTYLGAILLGLVFPAGFLSLKDYLSKRIEDEVQVEKETRLPVIASVMFDIQSKKYRPLTTHPYNDSAFQAIRHYLRFHKKQVVGVTSMTGNEGKTYCAINLAVAFAKAGHRTLLIDTDFHQSDVGTVFNLDGTPGLIDVLPDLSKLEINRTSVPDLDVIGAGQVLENSRSALLHSSLEKLLADVRNTYAYIIIDTCPMGLLSDYFLFADYLDYTLVVVRSDVSKWKNITRLNSLLTRHNMREKSGIVYNAIKVSREYKDYYKKIAS